MKKIVTFLLLILLSSGVFLGCAQDPDRASEDTTTESMTLTTSTALNDTTASEELSESNENASDDLTIRLAGKDWGYPQPYTHDPRGPGSYNMFLIFDSLLEKDETGLIPWLAKKYSISEDGKTYTFQLEEGVVWQDGQPFTANDVKFTFEYFIEHPPVRTDLFIDGETYIDAIDVVNDYEINITVTEANATLLEKMGTCRIIPEHIWANVDDLENFMDEDAVIGTGPYRLAAYDKEQGAYQFEAFEDFWGPKQRIQTIEQVPVSDSVLAFENGEIDYTRISQDVISRFADDPQYAFSIDPPYNGVRLMFNMTGSLADKNLRHAIAYAINQEEIITNVARGAGRPGNAGYIPTEHPYYNADAVNYAYNPDKAIELLNGKTYTFTLRTSESDVRVAELVKLYLEAVGITVEIEASDTKTNDQNVTTGNYELILQSVGGYGKDPDYLHAIFHTKDQSNSVSGSVLYGYSNPEVDALSEQQMTEMDSVARKALIMNLQELIAEDLPVYTIYNKTATNVYRPEKYDGWMYMYDHQWQYHSKLSYLTH